MEQKTIDTTLMRITNAHTDRVNQQRKAEAYSARCKRNRRVSMVRNGISMVVITIAIIVVFFIGGIIDGEPVNAKEITVNTMETRTIEAVLVGFDEETGDAILQTEDGHLWGLCDAPEVVYSVTFDTKGTEDVTDDEIIGLDCLEQEDNGNVILDFCYFNSSRYCFV